MDRGLIDRLFCRFFIGFRMIVCVGLEALLFGAAFLFAHQY